MDIVPNDDPTPLRSLGVSLLRRERDWPAIQAGVGLVKVNRRLLKITLVIDGREREQVGRYRNDVCGDPFLYILLRLRVEFLVSYDDVVVDRYRALMTAQNKLRYAAALHMFSEHTVSGPKPLQPCSWGPES
jgi:hypothetical protein